MKVDEVKVTRAAAEIESAIERMRSDGVSFDGLHALADRLASAEFSKEEVLAVAAAVKSGPARSKRQAVADIRNMLTDLKALALKTPM